MTNVIANEIFLKRRNNIRQGHFWRNCCKNKKIKEFLKNVDAIHPCPLIRQFLKIGGLQTIFWELAVFQFRFDSQQVNWDLKFNTRILYASSLRICQKTFTKYFYKNFKISWGHSLVPSLPYRNILFFGTIRQKLCKSRYQIFSVFSTFLDSFTVCQIFCLGLQDDFFVKYQVYFWFCLIFSVKWNPLLHGGFQKRTHADFTS